MRTTLRILLIITLCLNKSIAQNDNRNEYRIGIEVGNTPLYTIIDEININPIDYTSLEFSFDSQQLKKTKCYFSTVFMLGSGELAIPESSNMHSFELNNYFINPGIGYVVWDGFSLNFSYLWGKLVNNRVYHLESNEHFQNRRVELQDNIGYHGWRAELRYYSPTFFKRLRVFGSLIYQKTYQNAPNNQLYYLYNYIPGATSGGFYDLQSSQFNNGNIAFRVFLAYTFLRKDDAPRF